MSAESDQPSKSQVTAAVIAMLSASSALIPPPTAPALPKKVALRRRGDSKPPTPDDPGAGNLSALDANQPLRSPPTPEELDAAQEAALAAFPEAVRAAARLAIKEIKGRSGIGVRPQAHLSESVRPSPIPTSLPLPRASVEVPPFPPAALDHPEVRAEWERAHRAAAEARFLLQPPVLKAYTEAKLACERWDSKQRGRKPSGDLRYPVPRERLDQIRREMTLGHESMLARAEGSIRSIATGDVVGVEYFGADEESPWIQIPVLVLQSDLDREAQRKRSTASRTPEQVAEEEANWDEMVEELMADLPEREPELVFPNLPELPADREPTACEAAAWVSAISKHLRYVERGEQIEAKRRNDAAKKVRTAAKREAERKNPESTAAAKKAVQRSKAAERQRRWRERKKTGKDDR